MRLLADLKMFARLAWGLPNFLHRRITLEETKEIVRQRLAQREDNFLRLVEKGIYGYPRSPYLPLLNLAQVELGDIRTMVRQKGLEDTLRALREAGVYVTFEEFKGRIPVVRDGHVLHVGPHDFDNPYLRHYYEDRSGGTTGMATRVPTDLDLLAAQTPNWMLGRAAHNALDVPMAIWFGPFPDGSGFNNVLRAVQAGRGVERWFSPIARGELRSSLRYDAANFAIISIARLYGADIPWPEPLRRDQAGVVARWMADTLATHGSCFFSSVVSTAMRVALAAQEEGIDLTGAAIMGGGEPPTRAKVRAITNSGARFLSIYYIAEAGQVGWGCAQPVDGNDNHLYKDMLALIQFPREVPGSGMTVDAFHITSLLAAAPKLMLNVETDDYGIIEERSCGCLLESCGYTEHVRDVRSFSKVTGEGVTLLGSEMIHILEEVLPARFGGSPLDYQLLEEEDEQGFTRLSLVISPRVEISDEVVVIETVMDALGQSSTAADIARAIWNQASTLRVKRAEPIWTARGKMMPLHRASISGQPADRASGREGVH